MLKASQPSEEQIERADRRRMRWAFLVFVIIWLLASMIAPVITFCVTENPLSFTLFGTLAPPVGLLFWIVKYLFRDDIDCWLAMLRIQHSALQRNKQAGITSDRSLPATGHQAVKGTQKKHK